MKKINVLFICKWNRFRSKAAEAILQKFGKENYEIKSAGIRLYHEPFVPKEVIQVLNKMGFNVSNKKSELIND